MTWRMYRAALEGKPWLPVSEELKEAKGYRPDKGLVDAVDVSIKLGQPLLLTGDPGTGKTGLAHSVAYHLFRKAPIVFNTKTTSSARDLFYQYDALRDFRESQKLQPGQTSETSKFITVDALGLAILRGQNTPGSQKYLPTDLQNQAPQRSVVLIDEIDKAPRDLPNDVLNEIERMEFSVKETGEHFCVTDKTLRPIVILTSNSEKLLPDAFLRRCVYYHLSFPDTIEKLTDIVSARLGDNTARVGWVQDAIAKFLKIRELPIKKKPATAELLSWLAVLDVLVTESGRGNLTDHPTYPHTLSTLLKDKDAFEIAKPLLSST